MKTVWAVWMLAVWAPASAAESIQEAFPTPEGAVRVPTDGFGTYLGQLELAPRGTPVRDYRGQVLHRSHRAIDLPMVAGDLQQCADTLMRIRGDYLRREGKPVSFHATNGQELPWARFAKGEKVVLKGNDLVWTTGGDGQWEGYLRSVFMWAGTDSLFRLDSVDATELITAGDILVEPGFPGHAVVLVDVARRGSEVLVLVAQGFMPAQTAHVLVGPEQGWFVYSGGVDLPIWRFREGHRRRFKEP